MNLASDETDIGVDHSAGKTEASTREGDSSGFRDVPYLLRCFVGYTER